MITQKRLKELLSYDVETGIFTRVTSTKGARVGSIAGRATKGRYVDIRVDGTRYGGHRLVWLYVYGNLPEIEIDHINHDRTDNRITNLRLAGHKANQKNRSLNKDNTSGVSGISKHISGWAVSIGGAGYIGLYKDFFEAVCMRKSLENELNYHENHGR